MMLYDFYKKILTLKRSENWVLVPSKNKSKLNIPQKYIPLIIKASTVTSKDEYNFSVTITEQAACVRFCPADFRSPTCL